MSIIQEDDKIRSQFSRLNIYTILLTYLTMLGCCNSLRRDISLIAVDGMPSSSFSNLIFFIATI
jgi:hypothetical protein